MGKAELIAAAEAAFAAVMSKTCACERCGGKGYHHGFGEHGHDPDWCSECGGAGYVPATTESEAWGAVVDLILAKVGQHATETADRLGDTYAQASPAMREMGKIRQEALQDFAEQLLDLPSP